jgi:hypothetical protein
MATGLERIAGKARFGPWLAGAKRQIPQNQRRAQSKQESYWQLLLAQKMPFIT